MTLAPLDPAPLDHRAHARRVGAPYHVRQYTPRPGNGSLLTATA